MKKVTHILKSISNPYIFIYKIYKHFELFSFYYMVFISIILNSYDFFFKKIKFQKYKYNYENVVGVKYFLR